MSGKQKKQEQRERVMRVMRVREIIVQAWQMASKKGSRVLVNSLLIDDHRYLPFTCDDDSVADDDEPFGRGVLDALSRGFFALTSLEPARGALVPSFSFVTIFA